MTISRFQTVQFNSQQFVESAGAILFRLSTHEICLLYLLDRDEYVLAKGRRNCEEATSDTAVREVQEETGYRCRLLPVTMSTRAPPEKEVGQLEDAPRTFFNITEPFFLQIRQLDDSNVKVIWWFIAATCEDGIDYEEQKGERKFKAIFYDYDKAVQKLSFENDRDIIRNAIDIVKATYD